MKHSKRLLKNFINSSTVKHLKKDVISKIKGGTNNDIVTEVENNIINDDIDNL